MRMRTLRMMAVLILGAGSLELAVAQTKIVEKDAISGGPGSSGHAGSRCEGKFFWDGNQRSVSLAGGPEKSGGFVMDARAE